jgi:type II secretory pathway component PulF
MSQNVSHVPSRPSLRPPDFVALALTGAALVALVLLTAVWLPSMAKMFADFGGTLPGPTRLVLARLWLPGCALPLALGGAAGALLPLRPALAVLAVAATVGATYLPIFQLADAVRAN